MLKSVNLFKRKCTHHCSIFPDLEAANNTLILLKTHRPFLFYAIEILCFMTKEVILCNKCVTFS